ncbi:MAG: hypothetical protein K2M12_04650 [Muribaculaceae bacterium]|nr:hypothetical protein [Muribaculaceae bacterium]
MVRKLILASILLAATACSRHGSDRPVAEPRAVAPLYGYFAGYEPGAVVPDSLRPAMAAFMAVLGQPELSDSAIAAWAASAQVRVFTPDVDSVFPTLEPVERSLGGVLARAAAEDIDFPHRSYAAVVWGRPQSIVFADSVMLIALNHYLGADYPGYASLPAYARSVKTPTHLAQDIAEALTATAYPRVAEADATVLSRLLYEGALAEARVRLCGISDAEALDYDAETYDELLAHEAEIWQLLVGRGLLYSTLPSDADRLVAPAPATAVLASNLPGRVGRFLGLRIVRSYLKRNPETPLATLLSPGFYNSPDALRESGY